jgi:uncharacterized protein
MTIAYHEPPSELSQETRDIHRALTSLVEELEAVAWYRQRIDVSKDDELRAIVQHNMEEEIEHASMSLEWLRRNFPKFDEVLRLYLFTSVPITEIEEHANGEAKETPKERAAGNLGIGSLKS